MVGLVRASKKWRERGVHPHVVGHVLVVVRARTKPAAVLHQGRKSRSSVLDGRPCVRRPDLYVIERYRDFAAMREHLANIGDDIMQALLKVCSMSGDIFATPTPELRKAIEGLDIRLYSPYQPM